MNIDRIIETFNRHRVACLLIGGVNFLLRHEPYFTFDIDFWIMDCPENLRRCEEALASLDAEWGAGDDDWKPVVQRPPGWLASQAVFCLASPFGAIGIFRFVQGLANWEESNLNALSGQTASGVEYRGISDRDMLLCQEALPEPMRKLDRVRTLRKALSANDTV